MMSKTLICWACALCCVALMVLLQACAPAPVATKGGKACLDCHAEYKSLYDQGVIHQPVKKGDCAGCHRNHGLIGGAFLKVEEPKLCFSCHQDFARDLGTSSNLHSPVQQGHCSACHQSHNAPEPALLVKPGDQICFDCHDQAGFLRKFVHQPLEEGCNSCHETHGSKNGKLLIAEETALCRSCHAIDGRSFVDQHGGYQPVNGCSDCHSVHSADNPELLKAHSHAPVAGLECNSCHAAADAAQPFAVMDESANLCFQCHSELEEPFKAPQAHAPVTDGDCLACHSPHASEYVGLIEQNPQNLCFDCHNFKMFGPESVAEHPGAAHSAASSGDCLACHGPHLPAPGEAFLLRKSGNSLCIDCHAEKGQSQRVNHEPVRDGQCLTCHVPHESVYVGVLAKAQRPLCADCHEVVGEDLGLPNLHRPFVSGKCASCHAVHGGDNKNLIITDGDSTCGQCHGTIEEERQQATHQPFKEGQCDKCHKSHGSSLPFMLADDAQSLCVPCHQDRLPPQDTPDGHQNCTACHYAHGNSETDYLFQEQPGLCLGCHNVDQYWANGVGHAPAVEGDCDACHDPHAPQLSKAKQADASLCADCHDVTSDTMKGLHQGITPHTSSCMSCHDPHGGPDATLTLPVKHSPFAEGDCSSCHTEGS